MERSQGLTGKNLRAWVGVVSGQSYGWQVTCRGPGERAHRIVTEIARIEETYRAKLQMQTVAPRRQRAIQFRSICALIQRVRPSIVVIIVSGWMLSGCTTYEPAPPPPPSPFDRAWNAALGAAQDEGVRVTSADRVSGMIRGYRDQQEVTISLQTQADGNVRIEMGARGPKGADSGLAGRISRAYDRRMGR